MTTNVLLKYYWQTQGSLLIICDGEAVLTKSMKPWVSNPLDKQFDIIHAIRANIQQTKIKWSSKHVQGHQNQVALDTNDKVRWNDAIDQAAKNHWMKIQTQLDPMMHSLLGEPWELWLENEKQSNNDWSNTPADKLWEHTGPIKHNSEEWTSSPLTGQWYK